MTPQNQKKWWQETTIYQIYPRSFQDSNGDGVGDLRGIIQRLDYLALLGIGAIWLSPVCRSPQEDNGYDISDYQDIDPIFGNLSDMEELIQEAGKRDIIIILDLVLNHTSDEHFWFREAKKSKDNPYHDYYIWRDGEASKEPNDMKACFGGSAWEWVPELEQYYFHQFSARQPDLNWDNEKVREEISAMIRWWMDKGIGGFRLDVIDQIAKRPDEKITVNGPDLHRYLKELNKNTFGGTNLVTVGETWGATTELAKQYSSPRGDEFSMVFQFEHVGLDQDGPEKWDLKPLSLVELKQVFKCWQQELYQSGWNSLFWNNHDLPRIVSRWGDDKNYLVESAKMFAILLYGMQGTPFIYQGEELGMTNFYQENISEYRDIETLNMYRERLTKGYQKDEIMRSIHAKSRDNARTPMQWSSGKNAGFTDGIPWIMLNSNYKTINVENQIKDDNSVFQCYRKLIWFRKIFSVFTDGNFQILLEEDERFFSYKREDQKYELMVICNFSGQKEKFPFMEKTENMQLIMGNYYKVKERNEDFLPYEARMYIRIK